MQLPEFEDPPLQEVALAVQFDPYAGLTIADLGAYWSSIRDRWPRAEPVRALGQTIEPVSAEPIWVVPEIDFGRPAGPGGRLRLVNEDGDSLLHVENGWFVRNWRKADAFDRYPRYEALRPQFDSSYQGFAEYIRMHYPTEVMRPNLWEVTYVNVIPAGPLWATPSDWPRILPGLLAMDADTAETSLQTLRSHWTFLLRPSIGRLHVHLQHARPLRGPLQTESLLMRLVARGPIASESDTSYGAGLDAGHAAIVDFFARVTSQEARNHWRQVR